jgi:hypothetical protein
MEPDVLTTRMQFKRAAVTEEFFCIHREAALKTRAASMQFAQLLACRSALNVLHPLVSV